jgi:3-oxoacyl-[acyl-carrier protein] reductase
VSIALVTGASRGIGRATAQRLAADGHTVAAAYGTDREAAEALAAELPGAIAVGGDLRAPETPARMVTEVEDRLGPIDVLIANAGTGSPPRRLEEITLEEWDALHAVNLRASFLLAQRVLPGMVERGFGRIVFVSSVAAFTGGVIGAHYASSKAGLHALSHSISQQAAGAGVTSNVVAPALIETDMLPGSPGELAERIPVGRLGRVDEVADLIAAVVANGYLTNQSILLDGGMHPA